MSCLGWTVEIEGTVDHALGAFDLINLMSIVQTAFAVSGSTPEEALGRATEAGEAAEDSRMREWSTNLKDGRSIKVRPVPAYRGAR